MRKPNYNMERQDRERAKQAKSAAKSENRAAKRDENKAEISPVEDQTQSRDSEKQKSHD